MNILENLIVKVNDMPNLIAYGRDDYALVKVASASQRLVELTTNPKGFNCGGLQVPENQTSLLWCAAYRPRFSSTRYASIGHDTIDTALADIMEIYQEYQEAERQENTEVCM